MPTQGFHYAGGTLHCGKIPLTEIAARTGTPAYVYSAQSIRENLRSYTESLTDIPHEIHYAVKANSSLAILSLLASEGAGFDVVSGGELFRVLAARGDPRRVVFSGAGKTVDELRYALDSRVGAVHCESAQELEILRQVAIETGTAPAIGLRVNPNVDARTHPYIATGLKEHKFGIPLEEAEALYRSAGRWAPLRFETVSCHVGSQVFDISVFLDTLQEMLSLASRLRDAGIGIQTINLGGGLGVGYESERPSVPIARYGSMLSETMHNTGFRVALEPGRSVVGQAGVLIAKILYRKVSGDKTFLVVDGAMNDLIRPALYRAHHEVLLVRESHGATSRCDVVGPVCESGDFLAKDRDLAPCKPGDLLAIATVGAYGFVQASNYNSRPRAAEVLVDDGRFRIVRKRESYEDLIRGETP